MLITIQKLYDPAHIEVHMLVLRGQRVLLDRELAALYGVTTKSLKQAVKRNIERFPEDFMFILSNDELNNWRSQFVTSNSDLMGLRHAPYAFTEQGVAMLSSVLRSDHAVLVNIQIIRTFVHLRNMIATHEDLKRQLETLELRYDEQFKIVFDAMRRLLTTEDEPAREIGF